MLFNSRLCHVCNDALRLAFESIGDRNSHKAVHHLTKESLIDSVLHRSCHLCRLIIYHLKLSWSPENRQGLEDLKEEPTSLTEDDFRSSDFDFATFPSSRVVLLSYMLGLPETLNLYAQIKLYGDGSDGIYGQVEFDCDGFNVDYLKAVVPRFWIFQEKETTMKWMLEGFPLEKMPKTFQHAVAVARWAEVRYIWIDSCCIIQGSTSDWEKEARMMQKVYRHTYCNISADHSMNSGGGCFIDRLAYKITPCPYNAPEIGQVFLLPQFDLTDPLRDSSIATRAWVTQERFLSSRIVHFTTDQLFWECASLYACETLPQGMPHVYDNSTSRHFRVSRNLQSSRPEDEQDNYEIWGRVCEDYSRCRLSFNSDKLIAFAGIVGEFQLRLPHDTYLAGLWKSDLLSGLLWKATALNGWPIQANGSHDPGADSYITASIPEIYRAPSWSWLGKDCGIFWQRRRKQFSSQSAIEILEASINLMKDNDHAGNIRGGHIKVRGALRAAQWTQEGDIESIVFDGKSGDQILGSSDDQPSPKANYFLIQRDTGREFPAKDIFCLPMRIDVSFKPETGGSLLIEGLILGLTKDADKYHRLGYFEAIGGAYFKALLYELRAPARELSHPWESIVLPFRSAEADANSGGTGGGIQYNKELFKEIEEREITIV
ncbi:hypothetical protein GQ44DRAFT_680231 [Phaeosphaeriaceae sp. PMI808]|nr:hypothetical protein GQ44DRAFT_680231 [Phaeosphaeriaceae sp. PMI808]